jgi:hypothetical protein
MRIFCFLHTDIRMSGQLCNTWRFQSVALTYSRDSLSQYATQRPGKLVLCQFPYFQMCEKNKLRPPLWYSDQNCWLQIRDPVFDSRNYQIF